MSALHWGVKASFLGYIQAMPDGSVTAEQGALLRGATAVFPRTDAAHPLRFRGALRFVGHGGVLDLRIADPAVEPRGEGGILSIRDPYDPAARLDLATIAALDAVAGTGLALTADGADLFFGPYVEGTPLDDFELRPAPE